MIVQWMERLGWEEEMPIEHPRIAKAIENAQRKVEARNFEIRKQVLEYDDVLNKQRETIYGLRHKLLMGEDLKDHVVEALQSVIEHLVLSHTDARLAEEWEYTGILNSAEQMFLPAKSISEHQLVEVANGRTEQLKEYLVEEAMKFYEEKEKRIGSETLRAFERYVMLRTIDTLWIDHLQNMDDLREGIGLRAYGQQDPLVVYKIESYQMFQDLLSAIKEDVVRFVFKMELTEESPKQQRRVRNVVTNSGKKYKKCCGANA
jgi:preprotein translocase subunit SecA